MVLSVRPLFFVSIRQGNDSPSHAMFLTSHETISSIGCGNHAIGKRQSLPAHANVVDMVFTGYEPGRWLRPARTYAPRQESSKPNSRIRPATLQNPPCLPPNVSLLTSKPARASCLGIQHPDASETFGMNEIPSEEADKIALQGSSPLHACAIEDQNPFVDANGTSDFTGQVLMGLNLLHGQKRRRRTNILWAIFNLLLWSAAVAILLAVRHLFYF